MKLASPSFSATQILIMSIKVLQLGVMEEILIGGTWSTKVPKSFESTFTVQIAALLVVVPIFFQAPWVRIHPISATGFTALLVAIGVLLNSNADKTKSDLGALIVGFSGCWLAGCLYWGWLRAFPVFHLPIEAFALPLALTGLKGRWRISSVFYLSSFVGTSFTDLMMVITGVMDFWPQVTSAPIQEASILLQVAASYLLRPLPCFEIVTGAISILFISKIISKKSRDSPLLKENWSIASIVLNTTLIVDGLFLITALAYPSLSGLI